MSPEALKGEKGRKQSSRAQKLAKTPWEEIEKQITTDRARIVYQRFFRKGIFAMNDIETGSSGADLQQARGSDTNREELQLNAIAQKQYKRRFAELTAAQQSWVLGRLSNRPGPVTLEASAPTGDNVAAAVNSGEQSPAAEAANAEIERVREITEIFAEEHARVNPDCRFIVEDLYSQAMENGNSPLEFLKAVRARV